MNCPVCNQPLASQRGTSLDPKDGITVYCPHRNCSADEVAGHGGSEATAQKIITQKFNRKFTDADTD